MQAILIAHVVLEGIGALILSDGFGVIGQRGLICVGAVIVLELCVIFAIGRFSRSLEREIAAMEEKKATKDADQ